MEIKTTEPRKATPFDEVGLLEEYLEINPRRKAVHQDGTKTRHFSAWLSNEKKRLKREEPRTYGNKVQTISAHPSLLKGLDGGEWGSKSEAIRQLVSRFLDEIEDIAEEVEEGDGTTITSISIPHALWRRLEMLNKNQLFSSIAEIFRMALLWGALWERSQADLRFLNFLRSGLYVSHFTGELKEGSKDPEGLNEPKEGGS